MVTSSPITVTACLMRPVGSNVSLGTSYGGTASGSVRRTGFGQGRRPSVSVSIVYLVVGQLISVLAIVINYSVIGQAKGLYFEHKK